jgi:ribonuclease Z
MAERFELVFLGTGSPLPSPDRCGSGTVIVAGDRHVLVDCGWGSARRLLPSGVRPSSIDTAIFTHMHTDHITDIPDFLFLRWTAGARNPLRVFGPRGTGEVFEGFMLALRQDIRFRLAHHGEKLHPDGIRVEVKELEASATPRVFLDEGGLRLESFEVDHFPVVPAFGYRAAFDGRTVVLSGDTAFCKPLLEAARGADLLVSEALNVSTLEQRRGALKASGATLQAALFGDIPSYHIATGDVAAMARDAGVGALVLSHVIPPISNEQGQVDAFIAGMDHVFRGPITVARDGQRITVAS